MKKLLLLPLFAVALGLAQPASADCALKQSTASQVVWLPTFVDSTDGDTAETALTIANTDIKLEKQGATTQANKNSGGATHVATGDYYITLDATDTNTVGNLKIKVKVAGALTNWIDCYVYTAAVYDAFFGSSAVGYVANAPVNVAQFGGTNGTFASGRPEVNVSHFGGTAGTFASGRPEVNTSHIGGSAISQSGGVANVNVAQVSTDSTAADTFETWLDGTAGSASPLGIVDQGTAQSATGTTLVLRSALAMADDTAIGMTLVACGSTQGYCQSRAVTDYTSSSDTATVDTWTVTPSGTVTYYLFGTAPNSGATGLDAAGVRAAVGLATANLDTQLSGIQSDTDNLQTRVPAALVSGRMDSSVGAYQTGLTPLQPTTSGRTLDVTATGEAGIDWANIGSPTTTVNLSGTTISTSQAVASVSGAVGSVTGAVGSVTGNVGGNVVGSVGSVTTVNDKTGYRLSATGVDDVWDEAKAGHVTAGTYGAYLDAAISGVSTGGASAATIADAVWDEARTGHTSPGTFGLYLDQQVSTVSGGGSTNVTQIEGVDATDALDARIAAAGLATASSLSTLTTRVGVPVGASISADIAGVQSDTDNLQTRTPAALVSGRMDSSVGAMQANTMTAAAAATDLGAEIGIAVRDTVAEDMGSVTLGCLQAVAGAILYGDRTTSGGNTTWREHTGTEVRATSVITSTGNATFTITCPTLP